MKKTITIDPVSRIEGHAKISLYLDEAGEVADARFHVTEFRGFESFCVGRPLAEMAGITSRICGICPVSHMLASAKAGDAILAVDIPPVATKLRRLMNLGQIVQSHALSFFHLSAPDLLLGWDSDPAQRNIFGLLAQEPAFARQGIRLRQFGQDIIESLGGSKIHPAWAVPGGVREPLVVDTCAALRKRIPEMLGIAQTALAHLGSYFDTHHNELDIFGEFPSLFMALVGKDDTWEHYEGDLRILNSNGIVLEASADVQRFSEFIAEAVVPWSYLKMPYYKPLGYPAGAYRVGPLARLNACKYMGTPRANGELISWRERYASGAGIVTASLQYHYARLIEILAAIERIELLLTEPDICDTHVRAQAGINRLEGVGVSEAPRGTLFHHYCVDKNGLMTHVNMVIATGQNNDAMNKTIKQIAQHYIHGAITGDIPEGLLNRIEAGVRAYDPCLSCSTHAVGQMPLHVRLIDADGRVLQEAFRNG